MAVAVQRIKTNVFHGHPCGSAIYSDTVERTHLDPNVHHGQLQVGIYDAQALKPLAQSSCVVSDTAECVVPAEAMSDVGSARQQLSSIEKCETHAQSLSRAS